MTIHFHSSHFVETKLSMLEYMLLLMYEQKNNWTLRELQQILNVAERTVVRSRNTLTTLKFLEKDEKRYNITDKMYGKDTKTPKFS